jgi:predicted RNase H-like nuclease (RuvC/YqgF family)
LCECFCLKLILHVPDLLTKRPSVDEISAILKTLEAEHESLQNTLKESHEIEIKLKKELEDKHVQAMSVMAEKLKASNKRVNTLATKLKAAEAEAADIDEMIFHKDFVLIYGSGMHMSFFFFQFGN